METTAMQSAALEPDNGRTKDVAILEELNRNYVRAAEQSDVRWFSEHLAEDFLSSSVDGSIIDRGEFLERVARPYPGSNLEAVDVRMRFFGDLALIHAGFKYRKPDGQMGSGRYTDTYARRQGRWLYVSAHFNRF
jgi:ketosteroid isomerase-like protein